MEAPIGQARKLRKTLKIENILLGYYIRFDKLQYLNSLINANENDVTVDVYIDLFNMLKQLYTTDIVSDKKLSITTSILNLVAHIRGYYKNRHHVYARIFLVYGDETTDAHINYWPVFGTLNEYRNTLNFDTIHSLIETQLELVKIVCAYIPNVYYIRKQCTFAVFAYNNILRETYDKDIISIILTRSKYAYQIPAVLPINKRVYIFRPSKSENQDVSICIDHNNVLQAYFNKLTPGSESDMYIKQINPNLLSILMPLNGCSDKNVDMAVNITKSSASLYSAIKDRTILNNYQTDIRYVYKALYGIHRYITQDLFESRFYAIDVVFQNGLYSQSIESKDFMWNINLNDPNTIKNINNTYFADNPIDLQNL